MGSGTKSTLGLLISRQFRKSHTPLAVVGLLSIVSGALLSLGALCGVRYPEMLDAKAAELNAPQVLAFTPNAKASRVEAVMRSDSRTQGIEKVPTLGESGHVLVKDAWLSTGLVYQDFGHEPEMGRSRIVGQTNTSVSSPAYVPYLFHTSGGYDLGDPFVVRNSTGQRTFHIAGFFENTYLGFTTMGALAIGLPSDSYAALAKDPSITASTILQAKVSPTSDAPQITAKITEALSGDGTPNLMTHVWDRALLSTAALAGPSIYAISLVVFTLVVTVVILMVIWFWIRSSLDQDLPALGVLNSVGVQPRTLRRSLTIPPTVVVLLGVLIGVAISYALVPSIASSLSGQTGMSWSPGFDIVSGLAITGGLSLIAYLLASRAARRLRKLRPVEALAGGAARRKLRRSWLPLASTKGPLNMLLGLKQAIANRTQTIMVVGVLAIVTFGAMFSAALFTNVLNNRDGFVKMLIGDFGDVAVVLTDQTDATKTLQEVRQLPGVASAIFKTYGEGTAGGVQGVTVVMDDFGQQAYSSVFRGREPQDAHEVAIGAQLAKQTGIGIGETIKVRAGATEQPYTVVGELSTIQYGGVRTNITTSGFQRLVPSFANRTIDISLTPGTDPQQVITQLESMPSKPFAMIIDQQQSIDSQLGAYMGMLGTLAWGILSITVVVAGLVVGLMVYTLLTRERKAFGVRKAIGFRTSQLMSQLTATYIPPTALGVAVGAITGLVAIPALLSQMLQFVGVYSAELTNSVWVVLTICFGLVALAAAMSLVGAFGVLRRGALQLMSPDRE